jgi:Carboxypeptidase regulatory-like domain
MVRQAISLLLVCANGLMVAGAIEAVSAQAIHGTLSGRVMDPSRAAIGEAVVRLLDVTTNAQATTVTNGEGAFNFSRVNPGRYRLTIEKPGFRQHVRDALLVTVNEQVVLEAILELGAVEDAVTVEGQSAVVQAKSSEISGLVDEKRVRELPLNGGNFQRLALLAPGASGGGANNPAFSGSRTVANSFTLHGGGFNDERGALGGVALGGGAADLSGATPNLISTEALREFRVISSNADATFGRGSGAQVNVVTRSGSNALNGSSYYYGRNDAFDARDFFNFGPFFDKRGHAVTPPFEQHLYGATLGGPIVRDRHFFFGSFEGLRQQLQQTASATVPNAALIGQIPGDLRRVYEVFYIGKGIVPAAGNPAGGFSALPAASRTAAIATGFPRAVFDGDLSNGEAGTVLLSTADTRNVTQDAGLFRTDHRLTPGLTLSARYALANPNLESNTRAVSGSVTETQRRWRSGLAQLVWTVSPRQILEARVSVLRSRRRDRPVDDVDPQLLAMGVTADYGLRSRVNGTSLSMLEVPPGLGFRDNQTVPQFAASHTWAQNRLTLRTGADVRRTDVDVLVVSNVAFYNFNGFVGPTGVLGSTAGQAQAVAGETVASLYGVPQGPPTPDRRWQNTEQEYFVQGDFTPTRNLTLNAGLRYSYFAVYAERDGVAANLYAVKDGQIVPNISPYTYGHVANVMAPVADGRPLYAPDRNNLQPRLGMAWSIGDSGREVLRAAYGTYADRPFQGLWDFGVLNYPFATSLSVFNLPFQLQDLPIANQPTQTRLIDPALRSPMTQRFNVTFEHQLGAHASVSAGYVGARTDGLYRFFEPNAQAEVPQDRRPDPRFARSRFLANASSSTYDALQIVGRHRLSRGLDLTAVYTFGGSRDDYSTTGSGALAAQMPSLLNLGASAAAGFQGGLPDQWVTRPVDVDWGPSDFDIRHSLVVSHLFELPFHRRANGSARSAETGRWPASSWPAPASLSA